MQVEIGEEMNHAACIRNGAGVTKEGEMAYYNYRDPDPVVYRFCGVDIKLFDDTWKLVVRKNGKRIFQLQRFGSAIPTCAVVLECMNEYFDDFLYVRKIPGDPRPQMERSLLPFYLISDIRNHNKRPTINMKKFDVFSTYFECFKTPPILNVFQMTDEAIERMR